MSVEFEIEETSFGARVKDASSGEVIGVATKLEGGTYSGLAFKPERVKTMTGTKVLPETSVGTRHQTLEDAAKAIAEVF
jgi:hypothetical protein